MSTELVDEFAQHLTDRFMSPMTIKCYRADLKEFFDWLNETAQIGLLEVAPEHTNKFVEMLKDAKMPATVLRKMSTLGTFYKWASRSKGISNPMKDANIQRPKSPSRHVQALDQQQVSQLFDNITASSELIKARDRAIFALILACGMRVSEIVELRIKHLSIREATASIHKGNKRLLGIGPAIHDLAKYLQLRIEKDKETSLQDDDYVFINCRGLHLSSRSVRRKLVEYTKKTPFHANPAILRHTFAKTYLQNGGDIYELTHTMGYKSDITTKQYYGGSQSVPISNVCEVCAVEQTENQV